MPSKKEIEEAEEKAGMYLTEPEKVNEPDAFVDTWGLIHTPQGLCGTAVALLDMMVKLHQTGQFKEEVEACKALAIRNINLAAKAFDEYEAKLG